MPRKQINPRSKVLLVAFSEQGEIIEELVVDYDEFYDGAPQLIDDARYRSQRGVFRIAGKIYNSGGNLQSEFENFCNKRGEFVRSIAIHEDGTVTEHGIG